MLTHEIRCDTLNDARGLFNDFSARGITCNISTGSPYVLVSIDSIRLVTNELTCTEWEFLATMAQAYDGTVHEI
jgi:hypothetical protein